MGNVDDPRPPFPPFDLDAALTKVQAVEDAWNTRDPHRVSLAYTADSVWRNRDQFITGRDEIVAFLTAKWEKELDYVLRKSLWGFRETRRTAATPVRGQPTSGVKDTTSRCGEPPHRLSGFRCVARRR
jgi:nuclear transport factor 2 (NTF2) superfamily protein